MGDSAGGSAGAAGGGARDGRAAPAVAAAVSSSAPGLAWVFVGSPFDVIRVRLQTTSRAQFAGPLHCVAQTIRHEGPLALWKGVKPQLLMSVPYSTAMFGVYSQLRPATPDRGTSEFYSGVFAAGMASGILVTAFHPLDVWRTRLQTQYEGRGRGMLRSLLATAERRSLLLRGVSMTTVRNLPGNGMFFTLHEFSLFKCREHNGFGIKSTDLQRLLCGGVTGIIFNLVLYPADVIKARMMVTTPRDGGPVRTARLLYQEAGAAGFFRGAGVTTLKAFPVNAAGFWALHFAQRMLGADQP